jgi:ankyrin repeat protein
VQLLLQQRETHTVLHCQANAECGCCGTLTPLMACKEPAAVKLLLAAGAAVGSVTSTGNTCLHVAAMHKYGFPTLCLLLKAGAAIGVVNRAGLTAAQVAQQQGNELIRALLVRAAKG